MSDMSETILPIYDKDEEFQRAYKVAATSTLLCQERLYVLHRLCVRASNQKGAVIEVGVCNGGSSYIMASALKGKKILHAYDTFAGHPEQIAEQDEEHHVHGGFAASEESVRKLLTGLAVDIHIGVFPHTFNLKVPICLAHIDCDIYLSTVDCLNHIWMWLIPGGVMVFDDYACISCPGTKLAVDEFCEREGTAAICSKSCQALLIK